MLAGQVCIVTGASEGIGQAIVKALAVDTDGNIVLASRQLPLLQQHVKELTEKGISAERFLAVKCDITNVGEIKALVQSTIQQFGKIDILINCAGLMYYQMAAKGYTDVRNCFKHFYPSIIAGMAQTD